MLIQVSVPESMLLLKILKIVGEKISALLENQVTLHLQVSFNIMFN